MPSRYVPALRDRLRMADSESISMKIAPNEPELSRSERLRRVLLVCMHFTRNLAYYRAAWVGKHLVNRKSQFWVSVNGNFVDFCVLEWCKLFGSEKEAHHWSRIVSNPACFQSGLLLHLSLNVEEFRTYVEEARHLRDKFIAHLDSERVMNIPLLDIMKKSIWFYFSHIVTSEMQLDDLAAIDCRWTDLDHYYQECAEEAKQIYDEHSP